MDVSAILEREPGDGSYLVEFAKCMEQHREKAICESGRPEALAVGLLMYTPDELATAALAGFEARLPVVMASAIYVSIVAQTFIRDSTIFRRATSREHALLYRLHGIAVSTAAFILRGIDDEMLRGAFRRFHDARADVEQGFLPRTRAWGEALAAEADENTYLYDDDE